MVSVGRVSCFSSCVLFYFYFNFYYYHYYYYYYLNVLLMLGRFTHGKLPGPKVALVGSVSQLTGPCFNNTGCSLVARGLSVRLIGYLLYTSLSPVDEARLSIPQVPLSSNSTSALTP